MATGGKFFPSAYISLRVLRRVGCTLPVELWYLGRNKEKEPWMEKACAGLNVRWIDADKVATIHPCQILNGWELKAFAVVHSRFREVLYLDSDCYPVSDPTYLFNDEAFKRHRAIFFPDKTEEDLHVWCPVHGVPDPRTILGIEPVHERAIESGEFVVDRERCWKELNLALHLNEHSDFWYKFMYGDKETFHLAWRKLRTEFTMPEGRWKWIPPAMIHHDMAGRDIFVHRCRGKFVLPWQNGQRSGFMSGQEHWNKVVQQLPHEEFCWTALADLVKLSGGPTASWPRPMRWLARRAKPEHAGLGDTVEWALRTASAATPLAGAVLVKRFGGEPLKDWRAFLNHKSCGACGNRKQVLNDEFPYWRPRELESPPNLATNIANDARPKLDRVTLVCIDTNHPLAGLRAIHKSMAQCRFADCLLVSSEPVKSPGVRCHVIKAFASTEDYSQFVMRDLLPLVTTDFILIVHWDGWVLNGKLWDDRWMQYDYIGAPQYHIPGGMNGGFSLRSRKLLEALRDFEPRHPEDVAICRDYRDELQKRGIRFASTAPISGRRDADIFAWERNPDGMEQIPDFPTFGFHGEIAMRALRLFPTQ
jgi:hypothetical protein